MNLFQKYGIKEVADVVFYTVNTAGDEEFYTPALYLDTLKVSTIEKTGEKVFAEGGLHNKQLVGWQYGKKISLKLEDALFSPASMSLIWGGKLNSRLSDYTSAIVKANIANKYGEKGFSLKAYPSPALTQEELDFLFECRRSAHGANMDEDEFLRGYFLRNHEEHIDENTIKKVAVTTDTLNCAKARISKLSDIGYMETSRADVEVVDRMEKCIVTDKDGFTISSKQQMDNLFKYYQNDDSESYTIYYDAKTMLPLVQINDDGLIEKGADHKFKLKIGTTYYKWTRTVKYKESENDAILGRQLTIDADTFPDDYRIVCETYIRNQKTGKDQRYQIIIYKAQVSSNTSVTLEAEGNPTTFSMEVDVLTPTNDIMMDMIELNVEEDKKEGGTRIIPQNPDYTYTKVYQAQDFVESIDIDNVEIY